MSTPESTVLVPSWDELAKRHESTARYHLAQARKHSSTLPARARQHLAEAQVAARLADAAKLEARRTMLLRDGFFEAAAKLDATEAARV